MTLDKIDLLDRTFSHSIVGYRRDEVDRLVAEAAESIGRLAEEKMALTRANDGLAREIAEYRAREATLRDTLLTTQRIVEELKGKAREEARRIVEAAKGEAAAIVAQVAFPDRLVIDVAGDGSIQMCIQELATAVCYGLPVKIVILNNGYLGMVRQWQELFYEKNYCATCLDVAPDFVKLAEAYGAAGFRVTDPGQVESVLAEAFALPRPVIVDVVVDREENVAPMVPAGKSITEMILV